MTRIFYAMGMGFGNPGMMARDRTEDGFKKAQIRGWDGLVPGP
jgi:hypothetical protein